MPTPRRTLALVALVALSSLTRPGGSQPLPAGSTAVEAPPGAPGQAAAASATPQPGALPDLAQARARLETLTEEVRGWGGRIGAMAVDVESGVPLLALDERGLYNPASNAKLLTAAAALRVLGPGHRYLTGLYGAASDDHVPELVLRGAGDPSLQTRDLWELARTLHAAGVRKVGDIAVDQGYFDDRYTPPAFDQQPHEWATFRAPVAAVSLNENTVLFTVRAGSRGQPASV
ncbi:MAG TPA: D-alanyl-D-alanine carboxypeptidase, partial [Candidatus Nanopelagicales bacterium]|nr:D-alanyl-D-alanine carboxypeptidase [Candidatus Nanopelagicales bacterium]